MNADLLVNRYRTFLLLVAGFSCVFTVVELWLEEHTGSPTQLIPFILSGLGVAAIAAALVRPQRITVTLLRTVMGATLVGSLFGLYEHIEHNWEFCQGDPPQRNFLRSAYGYAARRQPTACTRHFGPGSGPGHCRYLLSPCTASTRLRKLTDSSLSERPNMWPVSALDLPLGTPASRPLWF